jgi:hypothetical protein
MSNNPFEWRKNIKPTNNNEDMLKKIKYLIEMEEYEEARAFLDIYIEENDNPLKISIQRQLDQNIQKYDSENQSDIDYINRNLYDGSDPTMYHELDNKLIKDSITYQEKLQLYKFWSAYPEHKSNEYCLIMFKWFVDNSEVCCSDLLNHIIDRIKDVNVACFYYTLGRTRGFLSEVPHTIQYYEDYFKPEIIYIAQIEYANYSKNNLLEEKFLLKADSRTKCNTL